MKSVALTDDEIKALPDNYKSEITAKTYPAAFDPSHETQPFLPGTFFLGSQWVDLADGTSQPPAPFAPIHVAGVSGRSAFYVLMSLPTGKSDTLAYLKKLDDFQPHWIYVKSQRPPIGTLLREVNPALPQVPPLTTFALVRMANLIDANGEPVNSPLMESVQLRVIRTLSGGYQHATQSPFLFTLDQVKVMRGEGGLVAQKSQQAFEMVLRRLMTISNDRLERSYNSNGGSAGGAEVPLSNCMTCHSGGGEGGILP
jgi:hypothetical protein